MFLLHIGAPYHALLLSLFSHLLSVRAVFLLPVYNPSIILFFTPKLFTSVLFPFFPIALQRQNTEISKQIFPEKACRGLSPNFHIHAPVSDLVPRLVCLVCWRKNVDRSWEYINRSQAHECGNWGWGRAIPRKGIHKWDFRCSVLVFYTFVNNHWQRHLTGNRSPYTEKKSLFPGCRAEI